LIDTSNPELAAYLLKKVRKASFRPMEVDRKWIEREGELLLAVVEGSIMDIFPYHGAAEDIEDAILYKMAIFLKEREMELR
jgi:hypothetical protein